jgi:hypothetical protein
MRTCGRECEGHAEPARRTAVSRAAIRIALWLWLAFLTAGSLLPARPGVVAANHRTIHWLAFAVAASLTFAASRTRWKEILGAVAIFSLGLSLEFLQHLIGRNPMEWRDVSDDGFAILAAFTLYRLTGAWKPRGEPRPR